jgi:hypothetical protein
MTVDQALARDARPPPLLIALLNPVMRVVLRTPLGRLVRPFALLEFDGRRTGRRYRVPVGWHQIDSRRVVCTPASWRANFRDGIAVTVTFRGHRQDFTGTLVDDPEVVAAALQRLTDQNGSLRPIGVDIPIGHRVTAADVRAVDRALIRFTPGTTDTQQRSPRRACEPTTDAGLTTNRGQEGAGRAEPRYRTTAAIHAGSSGPTGADRAGLRSVPEIVGITVAIGE